MNQVQEGQPRSGPSSGPSSGKATSHEPGTNGIWTFIFIDMVVFALFFLVYVSERFRLSEVFAASQARLNPGFGLVGTLLLVCSSYFVAEAVRHVRQGNTRAAARFLNLTIAFGIGFAVNKVLEYSGKIAAGITPVTDGFFTFYFMITFFHLLHLLGVLVFVLHCRATLSREASRPAYRTKIENVGLFWHFVDLLWFFIFPLLYLTGRTI